jgi:DNA-binding MarR family transcriptional regulator
MRQVIVASDRLRASLAAALGIGVTELTALGHLAEAGQLIPKELSARLGITPGSVTGVADRLVAAGLVKREAHPTDRRSILLRPTPAGVHARQWAEEQFDALFQRAMNGQGAALAAELVPFLHHAAKLLQASRNEPVRP